MTAAGDVRRPIAGLLCRILLPAVVLAIALLPGRATGEIADPQQAIAVDIPAQPLEDALYAFGLAARVAVFVDGAAVSGRLSSAVKGAMTPAEALRLLLTGTGLEVQSVGLRAVTLVPQRRPDATVQAVHRRYSAALQDAALRQLCHDELTRLGSYRIAMRIWVDERGQAARVDLLSSTGDDARDSRLRELVQRVSGGTPPPQLPQPIVLVILPRAPDATGDCPAAGAAAEGSAGPR